ncbi:MAG: isomerase [Flavobacteriales bacterium]|mgnify:CR=1 FL=1|nr:isomerase [Flavobacteriales bacterium]|tara:strand:- start:573 stop:1364 length:792 start_codon:yes stop_codon:yes gene_type:complete
MKYNIYQVDAFSNQVFGGNPACVIPLKKWMSDAILLQIAQENAVSETAFFIDKGRDIYLRWFTPDHEIDLCGHATLATAHVLKKKLKYPLNEIKFNTMSGILKVNCVDDVYYLDFPSRPGEIALLPKKIEQSLNIQPKQVFKSRDYMLVYDTQKEIEDIKINRHFFDQVNLGHGGVIVTSKANLIGIDFVSRYFTPQATILEDFVTGSAHCTLIPFWSSRLNKKKLEALQISHRVGRLRCVDMLDRVIIGGEAKLFSQGEFIM